MEILEFNKVLAKSLDIVDLGIKMGYFDPNKSEELNNKLVAIFNNGIEYDLPGTAVYGMYKPGEKKLYFNAKVFKNEEDALVYILHEIKHGLDHYDESIGFEVNDKNVGSNEGATQRFATDMAEAMLGVKFPRTIQTSLGIQINTHLDEYQIEDKLNELFCLAMGISLEKFIQMQNSPQNHEFKELIDKFNQHASYDAFRSYLDGIYEIQTETWFDEYGNTLGQEKKPTLDQTRRALKLINSCKREIISYAKMENPSCIDRIEEETFVAINEYGEIIRPDYEGETLDQRESELQEPMTEENIIAQADYINYHHNILNQINSDILNNECSVVFVTEFRYEQERCDKVVFFRKGNLYQKMIIPVLDDMRLDISNASVQKVDDLNEIKASIEDCEAEFGVIANATEYAQILNTLGENDRSKTVLKKWEYYMSKQDELDEIRQRHQAQSQAFADFLKSTRDSMDSEETQSQQSYFNNLFKKEIRYGNIYINEDGISIINPDGTVKIVTEEEAQECLSQLQNAIDSGEIILNIAQRSLLNSYSNADSPKKR